MTTTRRRQHQRKTKRAKAGETSKLLERYKAEAKEIESAKQAMERLHRGIEFEPERLQYVTSSFGG